MNTRPRRPDAALRYRSVGRSRRLPRHQQPSARSARRAAWDAATNQGLEAVVLLSPEVVLIRVDLGVHFGFHGSQELPTPSPSPPWVTGTTEDRVRAGKCYGTRGRVVSVPVPAAARWPSRGSAPGPRPRRHAGPAPGCNLEPRRSPSYERRARRLRPPPPPARPDSQNPHRPPRRRVSRLRRPVRGLTARPTRNRAPRQRPSGGRYSTP